MTQDKQSREGRVQAVIASLTDVQRSAILGKTRWLTHAKSLDWPMCGTVERMAEAQTMWKATSFGLEVRAALKQAEAGDE